MDTVTVQLLTILVSLVQISKGQDSNCSFSEYVLPNKTYYIYSPNYPKSYGYGWTCRWLATCPSNYNCLLNCKIQLPQSNNCVMDRLLVSRTGDVNLVGADTYCGTGSFTFTSIANRISVGLLTSPYTTGGKFVCLMTAQPATVNPPCSCGWRKANRIVGGVETSMNEFPFMVAVQDRRIKQIKCGAAIISERYALTAGHCLADHTPATLNLIAGEHNTKLNDTRTQVLQVEKFIVHPYINLTTYDYDIALIKTRTSFVFSDTVGPICLPFKYSSASFAGAQVIGMGWGTTSPGGPTSDYLQKVILDVISNSNCESRNQRVTARQMCTYSPGKDTCQDDSGGPLAFTESSTGLYYSAAVVSYGALCAQWPAVNTRTTSHLDWIIANSPDANYCRKY